jgi:hypothetical protein
VVVAGQRRPRLEHAIPPPQMPRQPKRRANRSRKKALGASSYTGADSNRVRCSGHRVFVSVRSDTAKRAVTASRDGVSEAKDEWSTAVFSTERLRVEWGIPAGKWMASYGRSR